MRNALATLSVSSLGLVIACAGKSSDPTGDAGAQTSGATPDCGGGATPWFSIPNDCDYEIMIGDEAPIRGECGEPAVDRGLVSSSSQGATLMLKSGTSDDAQPYELLTFDITAPNQTWDELNGFDYSLGDPVDFGMSIAIVYRRAPTKSTITGPDVLIFDCTLILDPDRSSGSASTSDTFEANFSSAEPICRQGMSTFFLVHGTIDATCPISQDDRVANLHLTF